MKHFLLGSTQQVVSKASKILQEKHSNFEIAGVHHDFFFSKNKADICEIINNSCADVLWVGLGKPKSRNFVSGIVEILQRGKLDYYLIENSDVNALVDNIAKLSNHPIKVPYLYITLALQ